ncbi:MAG TPA: MXAN_5187 C-terminal domain-containing protein, partial [Kofleriaceae bacterium]|nr:MXAN_5187 C-terminal domain-containing protein [Kofleriaceae bacterium]
FTKSGATEEDTAKGKQLSDILKSGKVVQSSSQSVKVKIDGVDYYAAAIPMPRKTTSSKRMPKDYPPVTAGAMVLSPVTDVAGTGATIKIFIILLGAGALAISMLGLYLSHRRLIAQVDSIELGVTDIINGNVDRTFRPVGPELDGLANGLNVMLARLLGRPEPGEEEFDDEGNPIIPGRVEFEEGEEKPQTDPDLAALAQESEPDYYKRVFTEYVAARKAVGSPDDVSFENFIAKLKVNEGKLKAQYQCRAVRFRVITKDNKVSLKPVPIFA